uniref:ATP-binding protein n=1 Tax=Luteitalea sp. TaxID=2004800 RepID=UPI0037CAAB34
TLDAAAVLCEAVTEMDGVYPDSRYALALGSGPAPVRADPTLLHLTRDDARITVVVGNDCARGPGLSPEALLRGYARGANATGKPGLGMGLHLAQRIAEEMGASLRVELPSARRFEVRIEFPAAQEAAA